MSRKSISIAAAAAAAVLLLVFGIDWDITGDWEGVFLLSRGSGLEITDDLFPEDTPRFLAGFPIPWGTGDCRTAPNGSTVCREWDAARGRGVVRNLYPDGKKLLINLSRFRSFVGIPPSGIFVGGGLPPGDPDYIPGNRDETGMAFFDGRRWFHIWCNVNEGITPVSDPLQTVYPPRWRFLSSRLLERSGRETTIESRHEAIVDGVPLQVRKFFFYMTGERHFTLVTELVNTGTRPVSFFYLYGDEPWLGNYGTSEGNVGWVRGGLVKTEGLVDTRTTTFAGFFDYGNDLAGERHQYTMTANYIAWDPARPPDSVYFSNRVGQFSLPEPDGRKVPLSSRDCRYLGLQWQKTLAPGESFAFSLAVGMADTDPATGFPLPPSPLTPR